MPHTCLPDALWTDPRAVFLRKKRRRLWILLCDIERLSSRWHPDDVASWPDCVWAANLDVRSERQFSKDLAELRALGVLAEEAIKLQFCQEASAAAIMPTAQPSTAAPRPRYPSDERRKTQSNGHSIEHSVAAPQELHTDSAAEQPTTPQTLRNDSATAPQSTPQPSRMRACPDPDSGYPDSGTDDLYKNSGSGTPEIPESGTPEKPVLRASLAPPRLSTVERLAALGMDPAKAQARLTEFGEVRCQDALDALAYLAKAPDKPAGWIVNFLVQKKPLPAALVKAREAAQQQGMTMLSSVEGGGASHQQTAPTRPGPAGLQPIAETIKTVQGSQWRPPPGVDPPKDVLAAARDAVRRLG